MTGPAQQQPAAQPDEPDRDDEPVLPQTSRDERDEGWGDAPGHRDEAWYRAERPPHHG